MNKQNENHDVFYIPAYDNTYQIDTKNKVYHFPGCKKCRFKLGIKTIQKDRAQLEAEGYVPCSVCKPYKYL